MAEETQEDLSMEDILSSIRNILIEDNADQQAHKNELSEVEEKMPLSPLPEELSVFPDVDMSELPSDEGEEPLDLSPLELSDVNISAVEDEEPLTLDDDILDLSSSMIVDGKPQEETATADEPLALEPEISTAEPETVTFADVPEVEETQEEITPEDIDFTTSLAGMVFDEIHSEKTEQNSEIEEISLPEISDFAEEDDKDPTDGALLAATAKPEMEAVFDESEEEEVENVPAMDIDFAEIEEAEPIFAPEENAKKEFDANQIYDETPELPVVEESFVEETSSEEEPLVDNDTLNEILNLQSQVKEEPEPEAEVTPETEKGTDAIDVSASIISNFAKMFADKKEEVIPQTVVEEIKNTDMSLSMPLGGGNLTLEDIVKNTVSQIVEKNLQSLNLIATQEINRQTKVWLDANLPSLVEAVVKQEIERVMVKVGR